MSVTKSVYFFGLVEVKNIVEHGNRWTIKFFQKKKKMALFLLHEKQVLTFILSTYYLED